jgi:hypothetical protein
MPRKLDKIKRISAPSLPEIRRAVWDEAERAGDELGIAVAAEGTAGKPPRGAHLVAYLLCYYFTRPLGERNRILREGREGLERHLASDTPIPFLEVSPPVIVPAPSVAEGPASTEVVQPRGGTASGKIDRPKDPRGKRQRTRPHHAGVPEH